MSLQLVNISQQVCRDCVGRWHRTHFPPPGDVIRVGVCDQDGVLVGAGCAGRPVARGLDDGRTLEITRVATDGTRNANSMIYAALARAAFALGWRRVVTYTQAGETGASLTAAGYKTIAERPPRAGWKCLARPHADARGYLGVARTLWEKDPT